MHVIPEIQEPGSYHRDSLRSTLNGHRNSENSLLQVLAHINSPYTGPSLLSTVAILIIPYKMRRRSSALRTIPLMIGVLSPVSDFDR